MNNLKSMPAKFCISTGSFVIALILPIHNASAASISATVNQSGNNLLSTGSANFTQIPYDFTKQDLTILDKGIENLSVDLTVRQGLITTSNIDDLTLRLDGIDTGIKINESNLPQNLDTRLIIKGKPNNADQILAALKSDSLLVGSIGNTYTGDSDRLFFPSIPTTTLTIEPVPEPSTILGLGMVVGFGTLMKRQHTAKRHKTK